jgi:hypothetical protein
MVTLTVPPVSTLVDIFVKSPYPPAYHPVDWLSIVPQVTPLIYSY